MGQILYPILQTPKCFPRTFLPSLTLPAGSAPNTSHPLSGTPTAASEHHIPRPQGQKLSLAGLLRCFLALPVHKHPHISWALSITKWSSLPGIKTQVSGFPGGPVQESSLQCKGHWFNPWSRKIPHAAEQLSPQAPSTEPTHLEPMLHNKRNHCNGKPVHHNKE